MEDTSSPQHRKRPKLVWVIFLWYVFSFLYTGLSFALVYSGAVPLTSEQAAYLHSLSVFDHAVTGVSALLNLSGAIALFLLRKEALYLFGTGFVVIIVTTLLHAIFKGFLSALGGPGVWGMLIGLGIVAAVCWYTSRLKVRGVLV